MPTFSAALPELLEAHLQHLLQSGISPDVVRERGYRSVLSAGELEQWGVSMEFGADE
jgi:hypothetical protein